VVHDRLTVPANTEEQLAGDAAGVQVGAVAFVRFGGLSHESTLRFRR